MKTNQVKLWKKILISAWTLVGLGVFIFFACLASVRIEDRLENKRWYYQTTINDSLRLDKHYPDKEYVRIYNLNTRRYVSPKMRWVSRGVSEGDSLTVFCDMKGKRGFINLYTGEIVMKAAKEKLMTGAQALFTKMYENIAAQQQGAQGGPTPEAGPAPEGFNGDDVVDGDYKEI